MNKILITGANGQLGTELQNILKQRSDCTYIATDVAQLDLTDLSAVESFFEQNKGITHVVNCAAFTAVDAAESNIELCTKVNVDAPYNLARCATKHNVKMVHVSTDYVFDGTSCRPYKETDKPCPLSVYGSTKLKGEQKATEVCPSVIIFRTAWLYSPYGKNFVKTMLALGKDKEALSVVFDQVGSPTCAADLASAIMVAIDYPMWQAGIYHFSNEGVISWYDFTKAIHRIAGITTCNVKPILSAQYPTPAHRPSFSVFDKTKVKETFGIEIPYWEDSLRKTIEILNN